MTDPLRARLAALLEEEWDARATEDARYGLAIRSHAIRRCMSDLAALLREPPQPPPSHTAPNLAPRERARRAVLGIFTHDDVETRVADALVAAEEEAYKAAIEETARAAAPEEGKSDA